MTDAKPTPEQEAFFLDMMDEIKRLTVKHPSVTNMECVVILSRMIGMCIAASATSEHTALRAMSTVNIDRAVEHFPIYDRGSSFKN